MAEPGWNNGMAPYRGSPVWGENGSGFSCYERGFARGRCGVAGDDAIAADAADNNCDLKTTLWAHEMKDLPERKLP